MDIAEVPQRPRKPLTDAVRQLCDRVLMLTLEAGWG